MIYTSQKRSNFDFYKVCYNIQTCYPCSNQHMKKIFAEFFDSNTLEVCNILQKKNPHTNFKGWTNDDIIPFNYDILAPEGIPSLDINGATLIEVKSMLSYSALNSVISYFESRNELKTSYNYVVVYFKKGVSNLQEASLSNERIRFVSIQELKGRIKSSNIDADAFNSDLDKSKHWRDVREQILETACTVVSQGNNVLFLGAGVSASANMPSWKNLLQSLMGEVSKLKDETLQAFKQLSSHVYEQCGDSNLVMARYLQTAIKLSGNSDSFATIVQKYLYSKNHSSPLLLILSSIIKHKHVHEVITYNFDDILEQELEKRGMQQSIDFSSIAKDAEVSAHNTLPIYHVHGIIPENGATSNIVFSEEEYHERYKDIYHWSNIEQIHALSRTHCFFIGLSMDDPNLRRLLDISRRINESNTIPHYAFLKRTKLEDYCISDINNVCKYLHVSESLIDKKKQAEIYSLNYVVINNIFRDLGVNVIWFDSFDELPKLLARVFKINIYENHSNVHLYDLIGSNIEKIRTIEQGIPSFNIATLNAQDVLKFNSYKIQHQDEYKKLISDSKIILEELIKRIPQEKSDIIIKIANSFPQYNGSMKGFYEFLSSLVLRIKKNESEE